MLTEARRRRVLLILRGQWRANVLDAVELEEDLSGLEDLVVQHLVEAPYGLDAHVDVGEDSLPMGEWFGGDDACDAGLGFGRAGTARKTFSHELRRADGRNET